MFANVTYTAYRHQTPESNTGSTGAHSLMSVLSERCVGGGGKEHIFTELRQQHGGRYVCVCVSVCVCVCVCRGGIVVYGCTLAVLFACLYVSAFCFVFKMCVLQLCLLSGTICSLGRQ